MKAQPTKYDTRLKMWAKQTPYVKRLWLFTPPDLKPDAPAKGAINVAIEIDPIRPNSDSRTTWQNRETVDQIFREVNNFVERIKVRIYPYHEQSAELVAAAEETGILLYDRSTEAMPS